MLEREVSDFQFVLRKKIPEIHALPRLPEDSRAVPNASTYFLTRGFDDVRNSSCVLIETNSPSSSRAILDPSNMASRRSCVTKRTVLRNFCWSDKNSRCKSER